MKLDKMNFLISKYGLLYKHQIFYNCYGGNWTVHTYSFYNNTGCFTIHSLPQRGEIEFYFAPQISDKREELYQENIDITSIQKDKWKKYTRTPFFWWSEKRIINALAEILKEHLKENDCFFGIKVSEKCTEL